MKRYLINILYTLFVALFATSCDDAEYSIAGPIVFLQESVGGTGIAGQVTTVPMGGKKVTLKMALSDKVSEDVRLRFGIDETALAIYNKEQSSEYLLMDKSLYDLGGEVTISAGNYTSDNLEIMLNKIPEEIADQPLALPLTIEVISGNVTVAPVTSKYVIAVSPVLTNELAQFTGAPNLVNEDFTAFYPQYTVECRFQMQNSANRNRFVFNNGHLSGRFEDPQQDQDGHKAHSLVQFHVIPDKRINPELSFESNIWQHLAVSYNGRAITIYVNGAFAGTKEYPVENAGQFDFVKWFETNSYWNNCKLLITEVRVWSVCRTESQIQSNMKSVLPTSAGLEGYWRINKATYDEASKSFADLTGKGHPLTVSAQTIKWIKGVSSEDTSTEWVY
ncbi:MAG: DUF1735 domain-containing protein [Bacteroides uniformis]|nr:DUF1735 domain-containing protein [Bacteroidaceae bacterium]MDY4600805.1 DUF1735 domain-containing protein [Bacteroides uniformis]MDY4776929.1 DUF1735 domain-containing protein [Phocaeicola vulgatus]